MGKGGNEREQLTLTNLEKIQLRAMGLKQLRVLLIAAIEASEPIVFAIRSTPKYGGQGFLFKGCAQVADVRSEKGPTGWASIRELVRPTTWRTMVLP